MSKTEWIGARAKINLTLQVLGKRADGYHELELIFQPVTLADILEIEENDRNRLVFSCSVPAFENDENLVCRGYAALRQRFPGRIPGLNVRLTKHIPAGAGLGGGSTDCAALLRYLNRRYELGLSRNEMFSLGVQLGADVPACMLSRASLGHGVGERLTEIRTRASFPLLIAKPPCSFSTAEMYRRVDAVRFDPADYSSRMIRALEDGDPAAAAGSLYNTFERVVPEKERIQELKRLLRSAGAAGALMTGSGSAVFGIFESRVARDRAWEQLQGTAGCEWFSCETMNEEDGTF